MSSSTETTEVVEQRPTPQEMTNSLSGFDFIAIKSRYGASVEDMDGIQLLYALIFIAHRRDGLKENEAYQTAMKMTMGEAQDFFTEEADDIDPEDPDSPAGKGS